MLGTLKRRCWCEELASGDGDEFGGDAVCYVIFSDCRGGAGAGRRECGEGSVYVARGDDTGAGVGCTCRR